MTAIQPTPPTIELAIERPEWLPTAQWPFALRRYEHRAPGRDPLAIHYTDEGHGPVLLFVHAGMWSFIWRDVLADLRKDFRCVTLDFPGSGLSDGSPADVNLETFPAIANGLLDYLAIDSATLVVHDLGGAVGIAAAGQRPERFEGLVVTNSFAWKPEGLALKAMFAVMGSTPATFLLGSARAIPRATRSKAGVGRHYDKADRDAFFGPYRARTFARNFHRAMQSARRSTVLFESSAAALESDLRSLPVLTVFGEKNDQFGFADRWQELFAQCEQWTVSNGNHFPMCDDPSGYAQHLRSWHRRHVSRRSSATS